MVRRSVVCSKKNNEEVFGVVVDEDSWAVFSKSGCFRGYWWKTNLWRRFVRFFKRTYPFLFCEGMYRNGNLELMFDSGELWVKVSDVEKIYVKTLEN